MSVSTPSFKQQLKEQDGFRRWLLSLSREELLRAMVIRFQQTDSFSVVPSSTNNNTRQPGQGTESGRRRHDINVGCGSHELDLLLEMTRLQSPRPIPVHPRAMGYRPRCTRSDDWACLDYYWREEEGLAQTRPRLFQWSPYNKNINSNNADKNDGYQYGLNPELDRILGMTNGSGERNRTRSTTLNGNKKKEYGCLQYQVVARNKVAPWGDVYGLGQTWEQQDADYAIAQGTRLILGSCRNTSGSTNIINSRTFVNSSESRSFVLSEMVSSACFVPSSDNNGDIGDNHGGSTASSILRMLQVHQGATCSMLTCRQSTYL
jgi:hypothetical protein